MRMKMFDKGACGKAVCGCTFLSMKTHVTPGALNPKYMYAIIKSNQFHDKLDLCVYA